MHTCCFEQMTSLWISACQKVNKRLFPCATDGLCYPRSNYPWFSQPLVSRMCCSDLGGQQSLGGDGDAEVPGSDRCSSPCSAPVVIPTAGYPHRPQAARGSSLCSPCVEQVLVRGQGSRPCQNFSAINFVGSPAPGGSSALTHVRLGSS